MRRDEAGLALLATLIAAIFATALATGLVDALGGHGWFGNGSNAIQWVSGPATFAAVATGLWMRWNRTCAIPYCLRLGEHPVKGTLKKTCTHHHTLAHHQRVHDLHRDAHAATGRLGWGESHKRRT